MLATRLAAMLYLRWSLPLVAMCALSACGGGGGGDGGSTSAPGTMVTISGKITFERVPLNTSGPGLDSTTVDEPARGIRVEALNGSSDAVLASTTTNSTGDYSLQVSANQSVKIRAKAQMVSTTAPTMNFRVLDNMDSDTLYALVGSTSSSGTADSTRNLRAPSGWDGASYTSTRAAAPFAILDTVYKAKELVQPLLAGKDFPELNLYWNKENKDTVGALCTDDGDILTTFYTGGSADEDNCTSGGSLAAGIYILGFANSDTDEFDQHVIAHEFGHYVEDQFGRSDSIGGEHGDEQLDLRVAFSEGWGDAYSGMVLDDPVYRDTAQPTSDRVTFNMESGAAQVEGWFSEASVREILWDVFDSPANDDDTVTLGFAPLFAVMTNEQRTTDAFTSVYPFVSALRANNSPQASDIDALLTGESIFGTGDFGADETNTGGSTLSWPVYRTLVLNDPAIPPTLCTNNNFGDYNKLDNRRFLLFTVDNSALVTFTVNKSTTGGAAASDPDIIVYRDGIDLGLDGEDFDSVEPVEMTTPTELAAGTYAIQVYDYELVRTDADHDPNTTSCMTVAVTGTGS